jgi:starch-binding outer membrane protein, SusD/RagB family
MKNQYLWFLLIFLMMVSACDLEESPVATTTKQEVFGTETGLQLYANSFYNYMPSGNAIVTEAYLSDINARDNRHIFLTEGAFGPTSTTAGWEWGALRNINYFLENNTHPDVSVSVRRHFNGLARFWRAWFYFDKVVQFGDVPWINIPLDVSDEQLYGGRDPRALVMDSVLADLDYAIAHITGGDPSRTLVTRNVALAMKSRICLVEASYRKYHPDLGLANSANAWYEQSAAAAKVLMDEGAFNLYTGAGPEMSYRQLFISQSPVASEIIFGRAFDVNYNMNHAANWHYHSSTFGVRLSTTRTFINTYLMLDGTPFTETDGYETMVFSEEVKERDKRLQQTIMMGDYTRISAGRQIPGPPNFGYTLTGYHPIKWSLDDVYYDGDTRNDNFISILRYGEVLLNYAEAKAELGTLTDAEWAQTIGALRSRAGITGGLNALPTVVDPYMQQTFFPGITDPVILEVRRERGIELYLEVSRFTDIRRWRRGELMEMDYNGIYVPAVNQYMDLNEDGIPNVYFYHGDPPPVEDRIAGVYFINVSPGSDRRLSNDTSGELKWLDALPRKWEDKMYLYPIPEAHRIVNPNLGQNPGW